MQRERAAYNAFKRAFREAHPTVKRNNKYYQAVKAAYLAQNTGSTLDPCLSSPLPVSNGVSDCGDHGGRIDGEDRYDFVRHDERNGSRDAEAPANL